MIRQPIIAATGGLVGWLATAEAQGVAHTFMALATGVWMVAQTVALIRGGKGRRK